MRCSVKSASSVHTMLICRISKNITLNVEYVAPSFQAFLDKLYSDEDE